MQRPGNELIDRLAAEYVLGTLRGPARVRFERWRGAPALGRNVETAIRRWEDRLVHLADGVDAVDPAPRVWREVEGRIRFQSNRERGRAPAAWRGWALAASVALLALSIFWWIDRAPVGEWQVAAELRDAASAQSLWRVEYDRERGRLRVAATEPYALDSQQAHELWALPAAGGAPVSLGLLPQSGSVERDLTAAQRTALLVAAQLAVSREPAGGSPTGAPTGPVLVVTELRITA